MVLVVVVVVVVVVSRIRFFYFIRSKGVENVMQDSNCDLRSRLVPSILRFYVECQVSSDEIPRHCFPPP
jgi:hypothetical protein